MALDVKPTRSELINLKRRIKQTQNGYNLLKMKRYGLFHEFRTLLSEMIEAREGLVGTYREAVQSISLASAIEGGLAVKSAAIAISRHPEVTVCRGSNDDTSTSTFGCLSVTWAGGTTSTGGGNSTATINGWSP